LVGFPVRTGTSEFLLRIQQTATDLQLPLTCATTTHRKISPGARPWNNLGFWHGTGMNKRALIRKIVARLTDELAVYFRAAQASRAEATHEQSKAENKYDTRGLEASYLARGQSRQAAEIQAAIAAFETLDPRRFGAGEPIGVGAFVELDLNAEKTAYFIGPRAGGTEVVHEQREVQVITPQSPLGRQLLGRKQGDILKLNLAGAQTQYRVTMVV